ncbi:MAG: hypothetical protein DWQ10_02695 [Calditrichaeota bacterium]|nr:MAG: hypothetical protein DWQ10_02695 [Calditrichota bacterium]
MTKQLFIILCLSVGLQTSGFSQGNYDTVIYEMANFEKTASATYKEYQWLYYEKKQSAEELLVFEDLLGVYVKRLREAYETMVLLSDKNIVEARDIAARALIYRALTFLEKAPIDISYFERACYDYYDAMQLYENTDDVPTMFKQLPQRIRVGGRYYSRLIDLLDEKGRDLFAFGQVHISIQNFHVTSKFDPTQLQLVRHSTSAADSGFYTYRLAEDLLAKGFQKAMQTNRRHDLYLGLPAGTYYIRSRKAQNTEYVNLATIYVRPNQFIAYIVEPIADWVIFYETPEKLVKLNANEIEASLVNDSTATDSTKNAETNARIAQTGSEDKANQPTSVIRTTDAIARIVEEVLTGMTEEELDTLPINRTRKEFVKGLARMIISKVRGEYMTSWNHWTMSWTIAKSITEYYAANRQVSLPMVKLTYDVIKRLM